LTRPFFHEEMRALQDARDGRRVADAPQKHRLHTEFWEEDLAFIASLPCFFIATGDGEYMDCSIKSGDPGFVKVTGPAALEWPEYDGNSMYRTLGNIRRSPRVAGRAEVLEDAESLARHHGARFVVRLAAEEIFPNCPRYIPDFAGGGVSPHVPRPGATPPRPDWKARDDVRDVLPRDDPHREP
jgi:hypothetical protein